MTPDIEHQVQLAISHHPLSMRMAAKSINMPYRTFIYRAKLLGIYQPNQSGKGMRKDASSKQIPLDEILLGLHPQYQSNNIKRRLFQAGIKHDVCEICGITKWNNVHIVKHLDHINGNNSDHRLENLRILCPNCHSQTSTYAGKNKTVSRSLTSDAEMVNALQQSDNIRGALIHLGLAPKGANYKRAKRLVEQSAPPTIATE